MTAAAGEHLQVLTTAGSEQEAERIADVLLDGRLAACVQVVGPITSHYRWKGERRHDAEWLCIAKTRASLFDAVSGAIRTVHSYDVPEITAVPIVAGWDDYLAWITAETRR